MKSYPKYPSRSLLYSALVLIFITGIVFCHAQASKFANQLYVQGDYRAAAIEYKRLLSQDATNGADSLYAIQMLMRSLFQTSDRDGMFQVSNTYASVLNSGDLAARYNALLMLIEGYYIPAYGLLEYKTDPRARLLKALSLEYIGDSKAATTQLRELANGDQETAEMVKTALQVQQTVHKPHSVNPYLAGALGVIPGAGYAATGRYETALASLVLNSSLLVSSMELYRKDLKWSAGIVFSVFTGFYLGNIYGSASAAAKDRAIYKAAKLDEYLKANVEGLLRSSEDNPTQP